MVGICQKRGKCVDSFNIGNSSIDQIFNNLDNKSVVTQRLHVVRVNNEGSHAPNSGRYSINILDNLITSSNINVTWDTNSGRCHAYNYSIDGHMNQSQQPCT